MSKYTVDEKKVLDIMFGDLPPEEKKAAEDKYNQTKAVKIAEYKAKLRAEYAAKVPFSPAIEKAKRLNESVDSPFARRGIVLSYLHEKLGTCGSLTQAQKYFLHTLILELGGDLPIPTEEELDSFNLFPEEPGTSCSIK